MSIIDNVDVLPGRVIIRSATGIIRLDTDEDLFHTYDVLPPGSRSFGNINGGTDQTNDFVVGSCNPFATDVIGQIYMTGTGTYGVPYSRWITIDAGGEIVWLLSGPGTTAASAGTMVLNPHSFCSYRFYTVGGVVYMRQRVRLLAPASGVTYFMRAHQIDWRLECGRYN